MSADPNRHVQEYLDYYLDMKQPPHYAVMLKGPWGIGKSTLIRAYLEKRYVPPTDESDAISQAGPRYIYVSLFGLEKTDEIKTAILHKAYPFLASKAAKILARTTKAALKKFAFDPDLSAAELVDIPDAEVFIFDDLERNEMSPKAVLGYINRFVEHLGRKVILVAHEDAYNEPTYKEQREKIIGQTLQMRPVLDAALDSFVHAIDNAKARDFLVKQMSIITTVFRQSGSQNLRVLQQCIWIYARLLACLAERHFSNDAAMIELLRFTLAWSLELKSGSLAISDLEERKSNMERLVDRHFGGGDPSKFESRAQRYPDVELGSEALSTEVLMEILDQGFFDPSKIQASLDQSSWFIKPENEPAWRTVWFGIEREDATFYSAVDEMERLFAGREFLEPGLILQVFGLRLWLSSIGVLNKTEDAIAQECSAYLEDLYSSGKLEPLPFAYSPGDLSDGYGGLAFRTESSKFGGLSKQLRELRTKARADRYPAIGRELLGLMQTDPDLFFRRLCFTSSSDNLYARIPVLATIAPSDFVGTLLHQRPEAQKRIMSTFRSRYDSGELTRELADERSWLGTVRHELNDALPQLSTIGRERISRFIGWYMRALQAE